MLLIACYSHGQIGPLLWEKAESHYPKLFQTHSLLTHSSCRHRPRRTCSSPPDSSREGGRRQRPRSKGRKFASAHDSFILLCLLQPALLWRPQQIAYFPALSERLLVATLHKDYQSSLFRSTKIDTIHIAYVQKAKYLYRLLNRIREKHYIIREGGGELKTKL